MNWAPQLVLWPSYATSMPSITVTGAARAVMTRPAVSVFHDHPDVWKSLGIMAFLWLPYFERTQRKARQGRRLS
jgi:hypothetical protein